mmetsp:Transcript_17345/g.44074  ORF Transcript_17345/g.44074 Transcript_17345/m.44074 type:complete len:346 (+) Transcript_17345:319-1356(+)
MGANRERGCRDSSGFGALQADPLVPVAVHNAADNVHLGRVQLCQCVRGVRCQVDDVLFAIPEGLGVAGRVLGQVPVLQARRLPSQGGLQVPLEAGQVQVEGLLRVAVGGVGVAQLLAKTADLCLIHLLFKVKVHHNTLPALHGRLEPLLPCVLVGAPLRLLGARPLDVHFPLLFRHGLHLGRCLCLAFLLVRRPLGLLRRPLLRLDLRQPLLLGQLLLLILRHTFAALRAALLWGLPALICRPVSLVSGILTTLLCIAGRHLHKPGVAQLELARSEARGGVVRRVLPQQLRGVHVVQRRPGGAVWAAAGAGRLRGLPHLEAGWLVGIRRVLCQVLAGEHRRVAVV